MFLGTGRRNIFIDIAVVWTGGSMASKSGKPERMNSGGYDFGGYVPGADYTPRRRPVWKAVVAVVIVVGMVGFSAIILL